jgi:transcriptional regulator with XRE-family HTH domain
MGAIELKALLSKIPQTDLKDDAAFHELIRDGLRLSDTTDAAFAELVNFSRPTITRWKRGQAVPHPSIRATIYAVLRRELEHAQRILAVHAESRPGSGAPGASFSSTEQMAAKPYS